jgi:hypothetical protein
MSTAISPAPDVVDLADVAEDIFAYNLEAVRRAVAEADDRPSPSALEYEPRLTEFVD